MIGTKNSKFFLGIDPGINGGCCVYDDLGTSIEVFNFNDTVISNFLHRKFKPEFIVMEKIHGAHGGSPSSTFNFGKYYGEWISYLKIMQNIFGVPYLLAPPSKWMKSIGLGRTGGDKTKAHNFVNTLYPHHKISLKLADSVLIAMYAAKIYNEAKGVT